MTAYKYKQSISETVKFHINVSQILCEQKTIYEELQQPFITKTKLLRNKL